MRHRQSAANAANHLFSFVTETAKATATATVKSERERERKRKRQRASERERKRQRQWQRSRRGLSELAAAPNKAQPKKKHNETRRTGEHGHKPNPTQHADTRGATSRLRNEGERIYKGSNEWDTGA